MTDDPEPPAPPPSPKARDVTAAEDAARNAPARLITEAEKARLAAEASRDEDA